jgi:tetratricopeptide (TPR) repeat protein
MSFPSDSFLFPVKLPGKRAAVLALAALLAGVAARAGAPPQEAAAPKPPASAKSVDPLRERAEELYSQSKMAEALPLFEKLVAARPDDKVMQERLGFCLMAVAAGIRDAETARQQRIRARAALLRAQQLGDTSDLLKVILESLPPDGSFSPFSGRKDVNDAMQRGEAAFTRGDFDQALASYHLALVLDPSQYEAALFTGDIYFREKKMDRAGDWYALAIGIDPGRETAYRYWGDALLREGQPEQARAKYLDAIIAEPYTQRSWAGLRNWSEVTHVQLTHPRIDIPASVQPANDSKNIKITLDNTALDNKETSPLWLAYSLERALWRGDKFSKEFPKEKTYRHSLREEASAMHLAAEVARERGKKHLRKVMKDLSVANLLKLDDEELLEAYILFARPDQGIAQDYLAYRKEHRDKLRQYLEEYVAPQPK